MSVAKDQLWAPWRSKFITQPGKKRCFLCTAARSHHDRQHYVIAKEPQVFALLNLYPYNNGHLMIAPRRHVGTLEAMTSLEWLGLFRLSQQLISRLKRTLHPHSFNLGFNVGRDAGAGLPGHLHLHLVPRWRGDTNFMPVFTGTKVISQSLEHVYTLLAMTRGTSR